MDTTEIIKKLEHRIEECRSEERRLRAEIDRHIDEEENGLGNSNRSTDNYYYHLGRAKELVEERCFLDLIKFQIELSNGGK